MFFRRIETRSRRASLGEQSRAHRRPSFDYGSTLRSGRRCSFIFHLSSFILYNHPMTSLFKSILPYRYRLAIFFLLGGASVVSVALYRFRGFWYEEDGFAFLIWNLFLAWIPLILAYTAWALSLGRKWLYLVDSHHRLRLADLPAQRALHHHRLQPPRRPKSQRAHLVRCHDADVVLVDRPPARHRLALPDAGYRPPRVRALGQAGSWFSLYPS